MQLPKNYDEYAIDVVTIIHCEIKDRTSYTFFKE